MTDSTPSKDNLTEVDCSSDGLPRVLTTAQATQFLWNQTGRSADARLYRARTSGLLTSKKLSGRHWWTLVALKKYADLYQDK